MYNRKLAAIFLSTMMAATTLFGCNTTETATEKESVQTTQEGQNAAAESADRKQYEGVLIEVSDEGVTVDGENAATDKNSAVYVGAEIIYYEEGHDSTYGEGSEEDAHTAQEAEKHTVITITQPGTYIVSGTLSAGQIAVDLGEDAREDENAVVNLVLDNADITCTVASAIVVYNAYECGEINEDTATKDVDTTGAGFNLILADDSENIVNGAYVAKIYKEGTTAEQVAAGEAKKAYKFDAAIDSLVSFNIDTETKGNGKLIVNAENEGIETSAHMTINGGNITINSCDDAINTNEDGVSVLTINGGTIVCDAGNGTEGDGIDSNGWIVMNGGSVLANANAKSQDSGIDSDMGIYLNGGTLIASGNMYDEISQDSQQLFMVLNFADSVKEGQLISIKDSNENIVLEYTAVRSFSTVVFSTADFKEGDYTVYVDGEQLQHTGAMSQGRQPQQMPEGEMPQMNEGAGAEGTRPEGTRQEGQYPQMNGNEMQGVQQEGMPDEQLQMPSDMGAQQAELSEASTVFSLSETSYMFSGVSVATAQ